MTPWRAILSIGVVVASFAPVQAKEPSLRKQLDDACDTLRRSAVKSTYGWGWGSDVELAPADKSKTPTERKRNAVVPDLDLATTATTALLLHFAGKEMNNTADVGAAVEAARAIAAVQLPTGQIPSTARLVPTPGGHVEDVGIVPDRRATCNSLALMLIVIESSGEHPDERLTAAATRAATWLAHQQTSSGGWQSSYPPGPGPKARRVIRLDDPGYRDATLTLLLASRVLNRQHYALAADRSIDQLLHLRIDDEFSPGRRLWATAYALGGDIVRDIPELPVRVDLLASRYSLETLLGARLNAPKATTDDALMLASLAADALAEPKGVWQRRREVFPRRAPDKAPADEPAAPDPFDNPAFARVLYSASSPAPSPTAKPAQQLAGKFSLTERFAQTICHLSPDALLAMGLKAPATQPVLLKNGEPRDLPDALTKAWSLVLQMNSQRPAK